MSGAIKKRGEWKRCAKHAPLNSALVCLWCEVERKRHRIDDLERTVRLVGMCLRRINTVGSEDEDIYEAAMNALAHAEETHYVH